MKKYIRLITILFFVAFDPIFSNSQTVYNKPIVTYNNDVTQLVYTNDDVTVIVGAVFKGEVQFNIYIKNTNGGALTILPEEITAYTFDKKGNKKDVKIYSSKDYLKKQKTKLLWFGPDNYQKQSVETTVKDRYGNVTTKAKTDVNVYTGEYDEKLAELNSKNASYLKRNTVFPNNVLNGYVI